MVAICLPCVASLTPLALVMSAPASAAPDALPEEEFVAPSKECLVGHWGNLDEKQQKASRSSTQHSDCTAAAGKLDKGREDRRTQFERRERDERRRCTRRLTSDHCGVLLRACPAVPLCVCRVQLYDELNASELALHHQTLDYLAGLDRARILRQQGREATVGQ